MNKLSINRSALLLLLFCWASSCKKFEKAGGAVPEPGVAFTFDDYNIDNWYEYLPLLDSLGIKATFYISNYHLLTPLQIEKLKALEAHGNEIGYHTTNHPDVVKYVTKHGMAALVENEIQPDLVRMRQDGFHPVVFAYPYGAHSQIIDNALLRYFKSVRALNGTPNYAKSLTSSNNEPLLYGLGIDNDGAKKDAEYNRLLNSAAENGNCLVLIAHCIEKGNTKLKVPVQRLFYLAKQAKQLHLKFYKVSEISVK